MTNSDNRSSCNSSSNSVCSAAVEVPGGDKVVEDVSGHLASLPTMYGDDLFLRSNTCSRTLAPSWQTQCLPVRKESFSNKKPLEQASCAALTNAVPSVCEDPYYRKKPLKKEGCRTALIDATPPCRRGVHGDLITGAESRSSSSTQESINFRSILPVDFFFSSQVRGILTIVA